MIYRILICLVLVVCHLNSMELNEQITTKTKSRDFFDIFGKNIPEEIIDINNKNNTPVKNKPLAIQTFSLDVEEIDMSKIYKHEINTYVNKGVRGFSEQLDSAIALMYQINDLLLLKETMYKWFNYDKHEKYM